MRERPIWFSAPMVLALLAGAKTQTRRVVRPQPANDPAKHHPIEPYHNGRGGWNWVLAATGHGAGDPFPCPYGQPGDRLWVRETHALENRYRNVWCKYAADGHHAVVPAPELVTIARPGVRPSIHMPRWASRITLEVTGVRVERLHDISEADAEAEGVRNSLHLPGGRFARENFAHLWWTINGDGSWEANPWVWVVEFKRITP